MVVAEAKFEDSDYREALNTVTRERDHARNLLALWQNSDPNLSAEIRKILSRIEPAAVNGFQKVRVGSHNDGGYVMLDDFENIKVAYSIGISIDVEWDRQIAARGIEVFQYDHTIESLPEKNPRFHWKKIGLGPESDVPNNLMTLSEMIRSNGHDLDLDDLILKVDIEAAEWDVFSSIDADELKRFRQIAIELHWLEKLQSPEYRLKMTRALNTLSEHHQVVHIHGNNYAPYVVVGGVPMPSVIELTLVKKEGKLFISNRETFPTALDAPNRPDASDFYLGFFKF